MSVVRPAARPGRFRPAPLSSAEADALALDAVPPGHTARVLLAALQCLDLAAAYAPLPLLACALSLTREGHPSPAGWHQHATESLPARWLLRGLAPSRSAWYASRGRLPGP
ncbi:MAG: hypothetical protein ACRC33_19055, partial [Gemmataceae bacterium]